MKLYTQKPKKYKQLQPEERGQIEAYYKMGMSISGIAQMLNRLKWRLFFLQHYLIRRHCDERSEEAISCSKVHS